MTDTEETPEVEKEAETVETTKEQEESDGEFGDAEAGPDPDAKE